MKKTIITAYLAACTLLAQGATLVQSWDSFSTLTAGDSLLNGATLNSDGSLSVTSNSGAEYTARPTVNLSGKSLTLTSGLTVSFSAKDFTNGAILVSLACDDLNYLAAFGVNTDIKGELFFNQTSANVEHTRPNGLGSNTDYAYYTFTVAGNADGGLDFYLYKNGKQYAYGVTKDAANEDGAAYMDDEITRLTLGGWSGPSTYSNTAVTLNELSIYRGAMDGTEVTAAYTAWSVPEPATATLSLLALAGLAARRRRK